METILIEDERNGAQTVITAQAGYELVSVVFNNDSDAPEIVRDPIVAWAVAEHLVFPVMPWARLDEPFCHESEPDDDGRSVYTGLVCPDGTVIGPLGFKRGPLKGFVAECHEVEKLCREVDESPSQPSPLGFH